MRKLFATAVLLAASAAAQTEGHWTLNVLLYLAWVSDHATYQTLVTGGWQMFGCVGWDADGRATSDAVCTSPQPQFDPQTGAITGW